MNCPQCGCAGFAPEKECSVCGFNAAHAEETPPPKIPMDKERRDVMNGVGMGCSTLAFVWFFAESVTFALAAHDPARWSIYGPLLSVGLPLFLGVVLYLRLRQKPSSFSKGFGISVAITLIFALLFAYIGTRYHDNKPSSNSNGFE